MRIRGVGVFEKVLRRGIRLSVASHELDVIREVRRALVLGTSKDGVVRRDQLARAAA